LVESPALVVVVVGGVALVILGVLAWCSPRSGTWELSRQPPFGVSGSILGAFFGVHAGLGDRERVDKERRVEATKGQMLAAMMPEENKRAALDMLKEYSPSQPDARLPERGSS